MDDCGRPVCVVVWLDLKTAVTKSQLSTVDDSRRNLRG